MSQPEITRSHSLFSLACRVDIAIDAGAATIWTLLTDAPDGSTDFSMEERFSGLMIPLAARSMPDFGPVFAGFASDLKREAERVG